jgi:hypothetical protein
MDLFLVFELWAQNFSMLAEGPRIIWSFQVINWLISVLVLPGRSRPLFALAWKTGNRYCWPAGASGLV